MRQKQEKSLGKTLFLTPSLIILGSFLIVFVIFNLVGSNYANQLASKTIDEEFNSIERMYEENDDMALDFIDSVEDSLILIPKTLFFEQDKKLMKDIIFWATDKEKAKGEKVIAYFQKNADSFLKGVNHTFKIGDHTYIGASRTYRLDYPDGKPKDEGQGQDYYAFVYVDITSLQNLFDALQVILLIILVVFSIVAIAVLMGVLHKVNRSFKVLESFLIRLGKREELAKCPSLPYQEFSAIADTTYQMAEAIKGFEIEQKQFFQNASHELRTPLMSIQGYTEGLKYGVLKDEDKAYDVILSESSKMANLVDEILFLSKFEQAPLEERRLDLRELLESVIGNVRPLIKEKELALNVIVPETSAVIADETMIKRAIQNLLSNAIRYAKTHIDLIVTHDDNMVSLHVIDDGDGIDENDRPHLFKRFYKGKGGNFGVGLSMANDIVKRHGGSLMLSDNREKTEFILALPMK